MSATPHTFGPGLFGWYHAPTGPPRGRGVVLVPAHGYDALCVHRAWAALADALASVGLPVLRFDLAGTGDSAGDDEEGERTSAWLASVGTAIDHLKATAGVEQVCVVGLRLGALLAVRAAAGRTDVESLALLAPVAAGRLYVRELKALAMTAPPLPGAPAPKPEEAQDLEAAGFVLTAPTLGALAALDVASVAARPAPRALVLHRPDLPADQKLLKALTALQVETTSEAFEGYVELMRDAHFSVTPAAAWAQVAAFAAQGAPAGALRGPTLPTSWDVPGAKEEAVRFGDGLFGVLTSPREGGTGKAVLVLNTGSNPHVGANRMSVQLARRLAARGLTTLRFDVGGMGDSAERPGPPEQRLYSKASCSDVKAALDFLETKGFARASGVGLCSGAYLAFHTAVEDERLEALVLINAQRFSWREGDSLEIAMRKSFKSTRFYVQQFFRAETWDRVRKGEVNVRGVAGVLLSRGAARLQSKAKDVLARLGTGSADGDASEVARGFFHVLGRGVRVLLVYSAQDGGLDELDAHLGAQGKKLDGKGDVTIELFEGADHTLTPRWARARLFQRLDGWL